MSKTSPIQAKALGTKPKVPTAPAEKKPIAEAVTALLVETTAIAEPQKETTQTNVSKKDSKKDDKKPKLEKVKMERDSFTMPKDEYAQINILKTRLTALGQPAKKSELLRAGIKLLAAMSDNTLKTTLAKIPVIKTGRPTKKS